MFLPYWWSLGLVFAAHHARPVKKGHPTAQTCPDQDGDLFSGAVLVRQQNVQVHRSDQDQIQKAQVEDCPYQTSQGQHCPYKDNSTHCPYFEARKSQGETRKATRAQKMADPRESIAASWAEQKRSFAAKLAAQREANVAELAAIREAQAAELAALKEEEQSSSESSLDEGEIPQNRPYKPIKLRDLELKLQGALEADGSYGRLLSSVNGLRDNIDAVQEAQMAFDILLSEPWNQNAARFLFNASFRVKTVPLTVEQLLKEPNSQRSLFDSRRLSNKRAMENNDLSLLKDYVNYHLAKDRPSFALCLDALAHPTVFAHLKPALQQAIVRLSEEEKRTMIPTLAVLMSENPRKHRLQKFLRRRLDESTNMVTVSLLANLEVFPAEEVLKNFNWKSSKLDAQRIQWFAALCTQHGLNFKTWMPQIPKKFARAMAYFAIGNPLNQFAFERVMKRKTGEGESDLELYLLAAQQHGKFLHPFLRKKSIKFQLKVIAQYPALVGEMILPDDLPPIADLLPSLNLPKPYLKAIIRKYTLPQLLDLVGQSFDHPEPFSQLLIDASSQ